MLYCENFAEKDEEVEGFRKILNNPFKKGNGTGYLDKLDDREYAYEPIKQVKDWNCIFV